MVEIDRNKIIIKGIIRSFDYPILQVEYYENIILVLLAIPPRITDMRNVFALDDKGGLLWQIAHIDNDSGERNTMRLIRIKNGKIWIFDYWGECFEVEKKSGEVRHLSKNEVYPNN